MVTNPGYKLPIFTDGNQFVDAKSDFNNVTVDFEGMLADPHFRTAAERFAWRSNIG